MLMLSLPLCGLAVSEPEQALFVDIAHPSRIEFCTLLMACV